MGGFVKFNTYKKQLGVGVGVGEVGVGRKRF